MLRESAITKQDQDRQSSTEGDWLGQTVSKYAQIGDLDIFTTNVYILLNPFNVKFVAH